MRIFEADPPEVHRIILAGVVPIKHDCLIGDYPGRAVGCRRIHSMRFEIGFGASHKKGAGLMQFIQAGEVDIPSIHHVDRASFRCEHVQYIHVVHLAVGDVDETRDVAPQIQQCVHLHGGLRGPEMRPREQ